ncbi:endonuclease/exonuclease/phosphatase family protein [Phaeacidiphilus oryzae]|uniref:endonuclease/exonuclease/phosphatase family protein n=1 Tax=Phaeacidiphilus oryzae TaxID=348818 RepID=UPI00389A1880
MLALLALLLAAVLAFHRQIPDGFGNLGSLTETFLPWFGLGVPVLLVLGLVRRSATALVALIAPVVVWGMLFGDQVTSKARHTGYDFTVVQHNVNANNPDPAGTAAALEAADPDVISMEELTARSLPSFESALRARYPYHAVEGTVGLWSRYPLSGTRPVDIRIGWTRALRTVVHDPKGDVAVFVAHMPSVRLKFDGGFTANERDDSAAALGSAISSDSDKRLVLLGDLNGTMNDRALAPITSQLRSAQGAAGDGFGFSWPARFPMARIDQIMSRGVSPVGAWTLPATASDHLPIAAHFTL